MNRFDGFEVIPFVVLTFEDGQEFTEPCNRDNPRLAGWGVYGHTTGLGVTHITDHATEQAADVHALVEENLRQSLAERHKYPPGSYVAQGDYQDVRDIIAFLRNLRVNNYALPDRPVKLA
jgi:hypothetical protein